MTTAEEIIENRTVAAVAAQVDGACQVQGMLAPALPGECKTSPATFVNVTVDIANQLLDVRAPRSPMEYSVAVRVRVATPDDKTGFLFRDLCRSVFAALVQFTGDGCSAFDRAATAEDEGFACDAFTIVGTSTEMDYAGDETAVAKTFSATLTGRTTSQN